MKFYGERNPAPNPRRVRIFIAEKGIDLPEIPVGMQKGGHKSPEHMARNSLGQVPTLELDDGTFLSESVSICRYLEALHPEKPLFGSTPLEAATIDMWIRRIEMRVMSPVGMFWVHAHPLTARLREQKYKDFGEANRKVYAGALKWLDGELADGRQFIAGDSYSMADIIALTTIDFASFTGLEIPGDCPHVAAWHARVTERPSSSANS
jgi:glutathione S-transferase